MSTSPPREIRTRARARVARTQARGTHGPSSYQYTRTRRPTNTSILTPTPPQLTVPFSWNWGALHSRDDVSSDVDLLAFAEATRHYNRIVEAFFGDTSAFAKLTASTINNNLGKVEDAVRRDPRRRRTLRAMIRLEKEDDRIHAPGAVLADPSGALGMVWTARGLSLWVHFFMHMDRQRRDPTLGEAGLRAAFCRAFDASFGTIAGWWAQRAFHLGSLIVTGQWDGPTGLALAVGPTVELVERDMMEWHAQMTKLLERVQRILEEYDCNDQRASAF